MKDDLVCRQAAIEALEKVAELFPWRVPGNRDTYDRYNEAWNDAIGRAEIEIEELPSAQPERKRGRWIYGEDNPGTGRDGWFCNECGHFEMWDYSADMKSAELNLPNYCPNCGAGMREGNNE